MELKIEQICKKYGKQVALNNVSATFHEGIYGLLGPNGAGKTTLISIIIGILNADKGRILLDGQDTIKMGKDYLDLIGFLPQSPLFYKDFTIWEFLDYIAALKDIPKHVRKERIEESLEQVNLTEEWKKKVGALSGGMRQRLGIAQAILNNPKVLVLDEPTAGLDPRERIRFRNIISNLSKDKIILLATHIVSDVEYISVGNVFLKKGQLIKQGNTQELCNDMRGKVWQVETTEQEIERWLDNYLIANMKIEQNKHFLRIISEEDLSSYGVKLDANLEDVFLSIFEC